jgi:hypothetical protein
MLKGPYVVINQLIKFIWKATHLKEKNIIHVRGEKICYFKLLYIRLFFTI